MFLRISNILIVCIFLVVLGIGCSKKGIHTEVSEQIDTKEKSVESTTEANKEILRHFIEEAWNQGNLNVIEECFSTNLAEIGRRNIPMYRTAFPDIHVTVEDQVAEGELVATRATVRGTHKGEFTGIPPTGKQVTVTALSICRIADGKIVENWDNWDRLGLMQQLGAIPWGRKDYAWGEPSRVTGAPGTPEKNSEIARRIGEEIFNQENMAVADELIHPDHIHNEAGMVMVGIDLFKGSVGKGGVIGWRAAFPDIHVVSDEIFAEGDKVAARWTATGTHTGSPFGSIPRTGKSVTFTGITISRIADGKIVESWWCMNRLDLLRQMGVIPSPKPQN